MARNVRRSNGSERHTRRRTDDCYYEQVCLHCALPILECICRTGIYYGGRNEHLMNLIQHKLQKFFTKHHKTFFGTDQCNLYNMLVHSDISKYPWYY
jgi:hypothetical protein